MRIFLNETEVDFKRRGIGDFYIGSGEEADIYYYKGRALKIYKNPTKCILDHDLAKELMKIDTKRILVPRELIYNSRKKYIGYSREFVENYYKEYVGKMKMSEFIREMSYLEEDIKKLSKHKIDIEDLNMSNILINNGIYISDLGSFIKMDELRKKQVLSNNKTTFKTFVIEDLLPSTTTISRPQFRPLGEQLYLEDSISDYLSSNCQNDNEKVNTFIKKMSLKLSK